VTSLEPVPDTAAAVEFLKLVYPRGPWVLTAIRPDRKAIETKTFRPESEAALLSWLKRLNGNHNLYWSTNPPMRDLSKKAEREDIKEVAYLHVDIDPRAGEDVASEGARILALFNEKLPAALPPPTVVLFSGGGYQAFWKLAEPIPIDGDLESAEAAKLFNLKIEQLLGGDNCHNVDRIMRLPGTINVPDESKLKKGRKPALAKLITFDRDRVYPLSMFTAASVVQQPFDAGPLAPVVIGDAVRTADPEELNQWNVPDRVKVIMVQGQHPDEPKEGDNSRSMWVLDFTCNMARYKVPEERTLGILLDPEYAISKSILEKGHNAQKYAARQIARAREFVKLDENDFERHKNQKISQTVNNMRLALHKFGVKISYNEFSGEPLVDGLPGAKFLDDHALITLRFAIQEKWDFLPDRTTLSELAISIALRNRFHPVREYLDSLKWDGEPRIDRWLKTYGGAEDSPYTRAVGLHWLTAAVRRVRQPGVKFDELLVLESPQGTNKSTALRILAVRDEWFSDNVVLGSDSKKVIEGTQGNWIIEAAELHGMSAAKSEQLKSFLSRQVDKARLSYDRLPKSVQRQSVFVGTTNSKHYLNDPTGNRRIWPVKIKEFDLEQLRRDVDQLWAEAAAREATGVDIHLEEALWKAAAVEQEARVEMHPFVDAFEDALGGLRGKFKCTDAWTILDLQPPHHTQRNKADIGTSIRSLGWERAKRMVDGDQKWYYVKGGQPERLIEVKRSGPGPAGLALKYKEHHEERYVQDDAPF
jgi:Virulence-associated protein E/RepB DNA-primase from phage plasmid